MKQLLLICAVVALMGCGREHIPQDPKEIKSTDLGRVLALEEKKVVGTYEWKTGKDIIRLIFLKSGIMESSSVLGDKENKWEIRDKEIHAEDRLGNGGCYRIEPNGDITKNAVLMNGKRSDLTKEEQMTFKKIK
jgi:antitoxin component YwqK of YwqJK toxin-antitoxin module